MTCSDVRRVLGLHLDSELSPERAADLARHLEGCADCADRVRAEERLEKRIRETLARPAPRDEEAWRLAVTSVPRRRRWWIPASVAASALAVAVFFATRHRELDLAAEMSKHHAKYVEGRAPLGVESPDPREAGRYFRGKLPFETEPGTLPEGSHLVGARLCYLKEAPAAFYVLHRGRAVVIVAVFASADLPRFPMADARLARGVVHCTVDGKAFVLTRQTNRAVTAVGDVPAEELERIARAFIGR